MNFLESILAQVKAEAAKLPSAANEATTAIQEGEAILASPGVQSLVSIFNKLVTHTSTPGAAVIVEPKVS